MPSSRPLVAVLSLLFAAVACAQPAPFKGEVIPIATDGKGIGFDDLRYAPVLHRVLIPAGRTGHIVLIDPATHRTASISGLATAKAYPGGHGEGATSVDEGDGAIFAIDRTAQQVVILDPAKREVTARAPLAANPDYVRWAGATNELWVTEPDAEQIEIFGVGADHATLTHAALIKVAGGPESLIVDSAGNRAYTHLWNGTSVALDLKARAVVQRWKNGCDGSRGIAYDAKRRFLFAGCAEGVAVVMDASRDGAILSKQKAGSGVDIIDYDPVRQHLYLPGGKSATMTIFAVSPAGILSPLATVPTASGAHCVTTDGSVAYVCDPSRGRILVVPDSYAAKP